MEEIKQLIIKNETSISMALIILKISKDIYVGLTENYQEKKHFATILEIETKKDHFEEVFIRGKHEKNQCIVIVTDTKDEIKKSNLH